MSPPGIDRLTQFGRKRLGVAVTKDGAEAAFVQLRRMGRKPKLLASGRCSLASGAFDIFDDAEAFADMFRSLAKKLPPEIRRADMPIFTSLPDACLHESILRFNTFPDDMNEALPLVRMRLLREDNTIEDPLCHFDVIANEPEVIVRVRSIERALRDTVETGARLAGWHIARIDSWSGYTAASVRALSDNGACLTSDGTSWSLTCWAENAPQGFFESGWIDQKATDVCQRITRLIHSFVLQHETQPLTLIMAAQPNLLPNLPQDILGATIPLEGFLPKGTTPAHGVAQWG